LNLDTGLLHNFHDDHMTSKSFFFIPMSFE
jgi:hypothetical protein